MGYIEGGWEFVYAAYSVTAAVLTLFAISIHARYRAERKRAERAEQQSGAAR